MVKTRSGYKKVKSLFGKYEDIPEEWEIQLVSKTQDIMMGQSPPSESYNQEKQGLPFYQGVTDFGYMYPNPSVWCTDPKKITAKDTILFSVRAPVGEVNITETQCCLGRGIAALNPAINDLMYCYYIINQNKKRFLIYAQGTTYDAINQKDISSVKLPHTKNILEQQKIASILSGVDALIESTQKIIEKTEMLKRGLMQKILTKGIGHTKFKKVKNFFNKDCDIPNSWEYPKFASLVKINPKTTTDAEFAAYVPMNAVNTNSSQVNYFERRKVSDISNLPKFLEYDVLFARITPSTENGKTALIENFQEIGVASSELTILRCNERVLPKYLYYYMKSYRIRSFAISQMLGTTNRQRVPEYVFEKDLNFELPLLSEQQKIASILSGVDARRHRNIIALIILRIKLAIFLILFVWISVNACKNILVAVQVMDRPLCETVLRTL